MSAAVLIGASALARQLTPGASGPDSALFDAFAAVAVAAAIIAVVGCAAPTLTATERRTTFWIGMPVALAATVGALITTLTSPLTALPTAHAVDPSVVLLSVGGTLLGAIIAVLAIRRGSVPLRLERMAAGVAGAPVVALMLYALFATVSAPVALVALEVPLACLVVATAALIGTLLTGTADRGVRRAVDAGGALLAVGWCSTWLVDTTAETTPWLALVLVGVTALVVAISPDGLFGSASRRRWLGWLALALLTSGLWSRLGGDQVVALEPYVLPLAGALLAIAAVLDRVARSRDPQQRAAPLVALGGLLVAIVPLGLEAASGSILRPTLVGAAAVLALAAGVLVTPRSAAQRDYLAALAFAGVTGTLAIGIGRSVADRVEGNPAPDLWFVGAALVAVTASVIFAGAPRGRGVQLDAGVRSIAAQLATAIVIIALASIEFPRLASNGPGAAPYGQAREIVAVVVLCALFMASTSRRSPFTAAVGWLSLAAAAFLVAGSLSVVAATGQQLLSPVELGTAPIAIALVVVGAIRLARTTDARSWPSLGPGLIVLLAPSLIATLVADSERPLWRLVGLGVVAIAVIFVGVARGLQAPLVLGSVVVIIHAVATFSTQIRTVYESVPWWLWLGVGGVLIIALAARYEHRIRNLQSVVTRVGSLR